MLFEIMLLIFFALYTPEIKIFYGICSGMPGHM